MRRSGLFSALAVLLLVPMAGRAQAWLTREGDEWVRTFHSSAAACPRLRISGHGPVTLTGGASSGFAYSVRVSVKTRSREQARLLLEKAVVRAERKGEWLVLTAPGGATMSSVVVKAPSLIEAFISTTDGAVEATAIDGPLHATTGADAVKVDRIKGDCTLATGGGDIYVGQVDGFLHGTTQGGSITARVVGRDADLRTNGGNIEVMQIGGPAQVQTGGGNIHLASVDGSVAAMNGGGQIVVDRATGVVSARNMAGPVRVGSAGGIRCESGNGMVQLSRIAGPIHVATSHGNINADLLTGRLAESYLATGNGDITVWIPSNLGVTISAESVLADSMRRIISDFKDIQPRARGAHLVAQGNVNGGGPLLEVVASSGTIFLKRQ